MTGFNYLVVEIFDRKIYPVYPKKTIDLKDADYQRICKAITWEVSHKDIDNQRAKGVRGPMYLLTVSIYNKNYRKKEIVMKPFWNEEYGGFDHTGKVPTTEKKVEVWMKPDWDYRISGPKKIDDKMVKRISKYFDKYIYRKIQFESRVDIEWYYIDYEPTLNNPAPQNKIQESKSTSQKPKFKEKKEVNSNKHVIGKR